MKPFVRCLMVTAGVRGSRARSSMLLSQTGRTASSSSSTTAPKITLRCAAAGSTSGGALPAHRTPRGGMARRPSQHVARYRAWRTTACRDDDEWYTLARRSADGGAWRRRRGVGLRETLMHLAAQNSSSTPIAAHFAVELQGPSPRTHARPIPNNVRCKRIRCSGTPCGNRCAS